MFVQQSLNLNKQNSDYINRFIQSFNKINNKQILSSDSHQSSQNQNTHLLQKENKLLIQIKKIKVKELIAKILTARRQKDRSNSLQQIYQEVRMFKIFTKWKKIIANTTRLKAQAQLIREKNQFHLFKKVYQQWANLIKKPKQQNYKIKQKWFQTLKIVCSNELSLRLRRIQLQSFLLKRRTRQVIYQLIQQLSGKQKNIQKAVNFWQIQTKHKILALLKTINTRENDQRLRYQQYKLAYLFRAKCLLSKAFKRLRCR